MKRSLLILCLLFFLPLWAQEDITILSQKDWINNQVTFDITTLLPAGELKPTNRFEAEQTIESEAPDLISHALSDLVVDSWDTIGTLYYRDPHFYGDLENLISGYNKTFSKTSQDMKEFIVRYTLNFNPDLVSLLVSHDRPITPDYLSSLSSNKEEFTGLIIYAGIPTPFHGTDEESLLAPALFPTIYDEEMNLIFDKTFVEPEYIKKWGMVQYSEEIPHTFLETRERIGMKPIKISLRQVYGRNKCDLIISKDDGDLILSSATVSNWLKEGRIIIIFKEDG